MKHEENPTFHPIDIVTGGFPCQDVSVAGKRAGLAGERSGLWFEFARVIDELGPRWVVAENVPGLLSSWSGDKPPSDLQEGQEWETTEESDFFTVIRWLAERGYGVCWRVLDAQYFGVPQRRRRVFIVASFGNGRSAEVLFERKGSSGNFEKGREAGKGTAETIIINLANGGANQNNVKQTNLMDTLDTWGTFAVMAHSQANAEIVSDGSPSLTRNHEAPILFEGRNLAAGEQSPTLQAKNSGGYSLNYTPMVIPPLRANGGVTSSPTMNKNNTDLDFLIWHNHQQDGTIRTQDDGTAPTVSRQWGTGGNNVPFVGVRRLTPLECERLQGFPDGWTDGQSDSARYKQLGNAVAVPVVEWLMRRIKNVGERM